MRIERLMELTGKGELKPPHPPAPEKALVRMHEYLEVVKNDKGDPGVQCVKCGTGFGSVRENYKKQALCRSRDVSVNKTVPEDKRFFYQEYFCPGCGTLLQVDTWCPVLDNEEPLWDIQIEL
jgi:acetone carboxylase gamma subunit